MALAEPVLCKRIPTAPWGDPTDRKLVTYEQFVATGGYEGLKKARALEPKAVIEVIKASELRGRGGAGFPAGVKWGFLPPEDGKRRYLTVNADESEPGTFKDHMLLDYDPHLLLEGIAICMHACRLDTAYIYIRGEYHLQAQKLINAVKEAYANGIFGPTSLLGQINGRDPACVVHRGAGAYICGEETGLLESLEGKRGWPRIKPPFPAVAGAFGRPTIINNVETLAICGPIMDKGAEWFKTMGKGRAAGVPATVPASFGPKLFGISGHVNRPGVYEENLGIKISELVNTYGGGIRGGKKLKAIVPGGISMGVLSADQYDTELDFDIGRKAACLGLGTAGVIIMDEDTDMVPVARNIARFFAHESCGQCTPCREGTGWMYKMLTRIEAGDGTTRDLDLLLELSGSMGAMPGTTICGLADGANWAIRTILNKFWGDFEKRVRKERYVSLQVASAAK
ncbi:MAG: NADH-quinone oxidoreductase subunit NuoF [Planctomycetota bacterium]|nr:NADH-quinone oxidoreductase subunit NuoF [Planctomycetota bacterium]